MFIFNPREMLLKAIENEVKARTTSQGGVYVLRKLIKEYNELGMNDDDLDFLLIDGHIPTATKYNNLKIEFFKPLEKNSIILVSMTEETDLMNISEIFTKIQGDESIDITIGTKFSIIEEHVIIIS